jgi:hypothetical protein
MEILVGQKNTIIIGDATAVPNALPLLPLAISGTLFAAKQLIQPHLLPLKKHS